MGRDLTTGEQILGANFDSTYKIYENLSLVMGLLVLGEDGGNGRMRRTT